MAAAEDAGAEGGTLEFVDAGASEDVGVVAFILVSADDELVGFPITDFDDDELVSTFVVDVDVRDVAELFHCCAFLSRFLGCRGLSPVFVRYSPFRLEFQGAARFEG